MFGSERRRQDLYLIRFFVSLKGLNNSTYAPYKAMLLIGLRLPFVIINVKEPHHFLASWLLELAFFCGSIAEGFSFFICNTKVEGGCSFLHFFITSKIIKAKGMFSRKRSVEDSIDEGPPFSESINLGCGYILPYLSKRNLPSCNYCNENHGTASYNERRCKKVQKITICMDSNAEDIEPMLSVRQIASKNGALQYHESNRRKKDQLNLDLEDLQKQNDDLLCNNQSLSQRNEELQEELSKLKEENSKLKQLQSLFTKVSATSGQLIPTISAAILTVIGLIMKHTQLSTRLQAVVDAIFKSKIFGERDTSIVLHDLAKDYARKSIFKPWKILRAMDLSPSGAFNYQGLEAFRGIEGLSKYQRGFIPSSPTVQRCAYELHNLAREIIPFEQRTVADGSEVFQFAYEQKLRFLLKTFGLDEIARHDSVELCVTMDGAVLTSALSHLTAGVKITDHRAVDPRTGLPLCSRLNNVTHHDSQSRNNCFVMKSMIGRDCRDSYEHFRDMFAFFDYIMKHGLPESQYGPAIQPIIVWSPQDLSSVWKTLGKGGGAKRRKHFCHLCPCLSENILFAKEDENRCERCKLAHQSKCFHWKVCDEDTIPVFQEELRVELDYYTERYGTTVSEVLQRSIVTYDPMAQNRFIDSRNIDFTPSNATDQFTFGSLLFEELELRQLPLNGTFEEKRA